MTHSSNTVSVIGADGMLGRAVVRALEENAKDFNVHPVVSQGGVHSLPLTAPYVINCAGIVRGRTDANSNRIVMANTLLPHWVVEWGNIKRMVTVSTDCVFDGLDGPYSENDQPTPTDLYARSKLAGEILDSDKALTVRTSFIGFGRHGLLRWLLTQPENASVTGYADHVWNGLYVATVAKALVSLCLRGRMTGLLHLTGATITKADLLRLIAGKVRPDITVVAKEIGARNHVLMSNREDEFDVGVRFGTSFTQLTKDYHEWGKDYLQGRSTDVEEAL